MKLKLDLDMDFKQFIIYLLSFMVMLFVGKKIFWKVVSAILSIPGIIYYFAETGKFRK